MHRSATNGHTRKHKEDTCKIPKLEIADENARAPCVRSIEMFKYFYLHKDSNCYILMTSLK